MASTEQLAPEKEDWVKAAKEADEGRGFSLADMDLDDMEDVYYVLNVYTSFQKIRLRTLIQKLRAQQEQAAAIKW